MKFKLEDLFNRKIDLLEKRAIDNQYFIDELNEKQRLIYGSRDKGLA